MTIWFVDLKTGYVAESAAKDVAKQFAGNGGGLNRCIPGNAGRDSYDYTISGRRWWGRASSREEALRRAREAA